MHVRGLCVHVLCLCVACVVRRYLELHIAEVSLQLNLAQPQLLGLFRIQASLSFSACLGFRLASASLPNTEDDHPSICRSIHLSVHTKSIYPSTPLPTPVCLVAHPAARCPPGHPSIL